MHFDNLDRKKGYFCEINIAKNRTLNWKLLGQALSNYASIPQDVFQGLVTNCSSREEEWLPRPLLSGRGNPLPPEIPI